MRHRKHHFQLGLKREHRTALVAALAAALFKHERIQTTLIKAKALRPFAEKIITYAKKAALSADKLKKVHYRRLAVAKVRDEAAVKKLFTELATEFIKRPGGYTRIYKLGARIGDAAETALIELVKADDPGYKKNPRKAAKKAKAKTKTPSAPQKESEAPANAAVAETVTPTQTAAEPAASPAQASAEPVAPTISATNPL
jgi:large subunit ribosomal protein L17